jgi:L-serine dehydratase
LSANYKSVFDIIGPVMIGPSSSHTAGAVAIGHAARQVFHEPVLTIEVHYYESFAQTHLGHGTDYAIISGVLGFDPADARVPEAVNIARKQGIQVHFIEESGASPVGHPNTAIVQLKNAKRQIRLTGCSIGGGTIEVRQIKFDGFNIKPPGSLPLVLVRMTPSLATQFVQRLGQFTGINHRRQYTAGTQTLFEYSLNQRLRGTEQRQLRQLAPDLIYL